MANCAVDEVLLEKSLDFGHRVELMSFVDVALDVFMYAVDIPGHSDEVIESRSLQAQEDVVN